MRKMKFIGTVILSVLLSLTFLVGCSGNRLETPRRLTIDEDYLLSWGQVGGARSYRIEIRMGDGDPIEEVTRKTSFSLSDLEEGDYEIRVRSVGSSSGSTMSKWSDVIYFHKNYETGLTYERINNNTEYRISRVNKATGDIVIEDEYRGKPVTEIGVRAFRMTTKVNSVVVGKNVRTIGDYAFYNCTSLTSITIPDSVSRIGEYAFQGCGLLTKFTVPQATQEILGNTFAYCRELGEVKFHEGVRFIGESAFYETALEEVVLPDSVTEIGEYAFSSINPLTSVTIGSGMTSIPNAAFSENPSLKKINFSERDGKELSIGSRAFYDCDALSEVELPEGVTEIGEYAFSADDSLEEVSIPSTVKTVAMGAFNSTKLYNDQLESGYVYADNWLVTTSPELRESVKTLNEDSFREGTVGIAGSAFYRCAVLESVQFPASVKYLGEMSFYQCPNLYLIYSPENGLESIGRYAFGGCTLLIRAQLNIGLKEIGPLAFYQCGLTNNEFGESIIPETVEHIGMNAFLDTALWKSPDEYGIIYAGNWVVGTPVETQEMGDIVTRIPLTARNVELKEDVVGISDYALIDAPVEVIQGTHRLKYIGAGAFAQCEGLREFNLHPSLREIPELAFFGCSSLLQIGTLSTGGFPAHMQSIGSMSFYRCSKLSTVDLSETDLKEIGILAFYGCRSLTDLTLNEGLETISPYGFYNCGIKELTLPDSVKEIGERAFGICTSLETIHWSENLESIGVLAFRQCRSLTEISFPDSLKRIDNYAFYGCLNLEKVAFGNGIERIGDYAFWNTHIKSLVLPASLNYVGDAAFKMASGLQDLESVTILGNIGYIGANAFSGRRVTFYLENEVGSGWHGSWNFEYRPVLQGVTFSEEGYVESVTVTENMLLNAFSWGGLYGPYREGYVFSGWSLNADAETVEIGINELPSAEIGVELYAVWEEAPEPEEPEEPDEPEGEQPPEGSEEGQTPENEPIAWVEDTLRQYLASLDLTEEEKEEILRELE